MRSLRAAHALRLSRESIEATDEAGNVSESETIPIIVGNNARVLEKAELTWDPSRREIAGDAEANAFLVREYRKGYGIKA